MAEWTRLLRADPTEWLLEGSNPSVRYLTLRNIVGRGVAHPDVKQARADIMKTGVVPKILGRNTGEGWSSPGRFYRDKYKGTVWQLIILAEHEADKENPQIRNACEYILRYSQDPESHGFAYDPGSDGVGGRHSDVVPCLTGNMVWSLLKLGYQDDERVRRGIEWITRYQRFDDGAATKPRGWPYDRYEMCWGRHSCHSGVVKSLKALSAVPKQHRNNDVKDSIRRGSDYILAHHIYRKSHDLEQTAKPSWLRLQFPLMYQSDILEIAGILLDLGIRDERMRDAVEVIASKQDEKGQWNLEATFNGRFWTNIERKNAPSRWITYRAMNVLKKYYA